MKKIQFINNGLLDPRSFKVMGMSAKDSDSAIGQFGTGLKYAIAGIIRTGGSVHIRTGKGDALKEFVFSCVSSEFRDQEFETIICNGEELAYTTEYGKHWEPWQWFRELHSNALDEGGRSVVDGDVLAEKYETCITVEHDDIHECWVEKDKYFLPKSARKISAHADCEVFHKLNNNALFYKGVKVAEWEDMRFTYNLTGNSSISLTEDRTLNYDWYAKEAIARGLSTLTKKEDVKRAIREKNANFNGLRSDDEFNETFIEMTREALLVSPNTTLADGLRDLFIQRAGTFERKEEEFTSRQLKQLEKVKGFLELIDFKVQHKIVKVESKGDSLYGQASDKGEIWLTEKAFEHGTFDLAATVLEEHVHLTTDHGDESRGLQDYLFRQLIIMGENLIDDIL